jgi:oxygen-independent coproporphyrinogen III oxidase
VEADRIEVQPRGRLLIRNICMQFDHYIGSASSRGSFSKVI